MNSGWSQKLTVSIYVQVSQEGFVGKKLPRHYAESLSCIKMPQMYKDGVILVTTVCLTKYESTKYKLLKNETLICKSYKSFR